MALDKYSKGLETDEFGNVVTEKYDAQLKPGANPIVPVVVDENSTHEALKRVAAENPDLELDDGGHYIEVEQPAPLEGDVAAAPGSAGDPGSGRQGGTQRSPVMEQVLEQDAENKQESAAAAEAQAADSEADGAEQQADEARAAADRAEARTADAARERAEAGASDQRGSDES